MPDPNSLEDARQMLVRELVKAEEPDARVGAFYEQLAALLDPASMLAAYERAGRVERVASSAYASCPDHRDHTALSELRRRTCDACKERREPVYRITEEGESNA